MFHQAAERKVVGMFASKEVATQAQEVSKELPELFDP